MSNVPPPPTEPFEGKRYIFYNALRTSREAAGSPHSPLGSVYQAREPVHHASVAGYPAAVKRR